MTTLIVIGGIWFSMLAGFLIAVRRSPLGSEDDRGFHYLSPVKARNNSTQLKFTHQIRTQLHWKKAA